MHTGIFLSVCAFPPEMATFAVQGNLSSIAPPSNDLKSTEKSLTASTIYIVLRKTVSVTDLCPLPPSRSLHGLRFFHALQAAHEGQDAAVRREEGLGRLQGLISLRARG